jgi:hypothetical protein
MGGCVVHTRSLLVLATALVGLACNEDLPGYNDPADVFDAHMDAAYVITRTDNSVRVYILVTNDYDETLQGRAAFGGQIAVVWTRDPSRRKTVTLTPAHLIYARSYNPNSQVLTLDPGDSIRLGFVWNLIDDDGVDLRQFFTYRQDPLCPARFISEPEFFRLSGEVKVFDRTALAVAPAWLYRLEHQDRWVMCEPSP